MSAPAPLPVPDGWTPQNGDIVWVEEGRFKGCILDYIEQQGGWHVCRNESFGGYVLLKAGDAIWDGIRTRKVSLYLTADEVRRRMLGEKIEGRPHVR